MQLVPPTANTKEPLIIYFGEALDHALARKSLTVYTKEGNQIDGQITLNDFEEVWQFVPINNWFSAASLEDLAGNNLNSLFDTNLELEQVASEKMPFYYRHFSVE